MALRLLETTGWTRLPLFLQLALGAGVFALLLVLVVYWSRGSRDQSAQCAHALNGRLRSADGPLLDELVRNVYIRGCYNCCAQGRFQSDYVGLCGLARALQQGARLLDFQVYWIDGQAQVAAGSDPAQPRGKETYDAVPLVQVVDLLRTHAFAQGTAPNPRDPLFVQLRICSQHVACADACADAFAGAESLLLGPAYSFDREDIGALPLRTLQGRIVVLLDTTNPVGLQSPRLHEIVNATSSSAQLRSLRAKDLTQSVDAQELTDFNRQHWTLVQPDAGADPPNPNFALARALGCQGLCARLAPDAAGDELAAFFDAAGTAFVAKPPELRAKPETIAAPAPQDPAVALAPRTVSTPYYQFQV